MEKFVIKRNGDYKPFESYKIKDAIEKSFESVTIPYDESIFNSVISSIDIKDTWAVEEIQDMIEKTLFQKEYFTFEQEISIRLIGTCAYCTVSFSLDVLGQMFYLLIEEETWPRSLILVSLRLNGISHIL